MWIHKPNKGLGEELICLETGARVTQRKNDGKHEVVVSVGNVSTVIHSGYEEAEAKQAFALLVKHAQEQRPFVEWHLSQ